MNHLGIELSTQSAKCVVIDQNKSILFEKTINYETGMRHYFTIAGFYSRSAVECISPLEMFIEAINILLSNIELEVGLDSIATVCGCAQQHACIYGNNRTITANSYTCTEYSKWFTNIWLDRSCQIEFDQVRSMKKINYWLITGSQICHRTSILNLMHNAQKIKFRQVYLISSWLTSLMTGKYYPPEYTDGAGTGCLNILTKEPVGVDFYPLESNIPFSNFVNPTNPLIVDHNNGLMNQAKKIYSFLSDNAASILYYDLHFPGDCVISLGTSDTFVIITETLHVFSTDWQIFPHPVHPNYYCAMLCFSNGDILRKTICDKYYNGNWDLFSLAISEQFNTRNAPNHGIFFTILPELIPLLSHGRIVRINSTKSVNPSVDVVISRFCSIISRIPESILMRRVVLTGGASNSEGIRIAAEFFFGKVHIGNSHNAAMHGAAIFPSIITSHGAKNISYQNGSHEMSPAVARLVDLHKKAEICALSV